MKKFYSLLIAAIIMLALPMGMKAAEGDVHDMNITQSTNLNNNAAIPSIEIDAQSYSVKTVTINWRYNKAIENPVTIEVLVGETSWGTQTITGNTTADAVFNGESTIGAITINFTNNTGSGTGHGTFYVNSVKLTEGEGGGPAPTTYTVTYHANVTGVADIEETYNEGATVTIADNTFSNPGYAFTEWNTEADGSGDSYDAGDEIEDIDDDLELYAQWEESNTATYTYNFAGANNFYTDAALTTHPSSGSGNNVGTIYYSDGSTFVASGTNRYFSSASSGYFMLGKTDAQISLPTFEGYKITQVKLHSSTGHSTSVSVSIVSGSSTASAAQTWSTKDHDYVYDIASNYQASALTVKVTNAYNTQFTSITLVCEAYVPSSVATPTFDPADGATFGNEGLTVSIACETPNTAIYYTVDGSTPDNSSTLYENAIILTTTATIKAIAYDGTNYSDMATATYTYLDPNAPGTENNPYTVAQARAAIDAGTGTQSVYATGIVSAIPTAWNSQYSNITFNFVDEEGDNNFLQAYRCVSGTGVNASEVAVSDVVVVYGNLTKYTNSNTGVTTYEFASGCQLVSLTHPAVEVEAPTFSPVAGTYAEEQTVTLNCATETATIFYTIDGTDPATSNSSTQYVNPITVSSTMTIKAVAVMGQYTSTVASATYHICSAENPYTVTEALSFSEYPANGIYVSGIVSTAPTSLSSGTLTYYISVDGETTNQLEVYKGKNLNNEAFTAVNDIQVGDIVTVYGNVQVYNSTIEFGSGNYLVSFERPTPVLEDYNLTVEPFENLEIITFVNDEMVMEADGDIQVTESAQVMLSIVADEGFVIATLMVNGVDHAGDIADDFTYTFTMPSEDVTISATAVEYVAPTASDYVRITSLDQLTDGSLVVIAARYDEDHTNGYYAMSNASSGKPTGVLFTSITSGNNETLPTTISDDEDDYYWTVNVTENGYTFTNADGDMIGCTSSTNFANGNNTEWTISIGTAAGSAMVGGYTGFVIRNGNTNTRAFAFNGTAFGAYATTNMTGSGYNFFLDFFVQTEEPAPETYTKTIIGYNSEQGNGSGNFYLIASPIGDVAPTNVTNMIKTDNNGKGYDLYRFNQNPVETEIDGVSTKLEWENYKQEGDHYHFNLESGKGYLYANSETVDLIFTGTAYSGTGEVSLTNNGDNDLSGWNLVGNPFTVKTYITGDYNVMNADGTEIIAATEDQDREENSVNPMEGIFVYTTEASTLQFSTTAPSKLSKRLALNLSRGRGVMDRAIVRFDDSQPMPKFQLKDNSTKVYIPMDGKDYAVVNAQEQGEMPVNFKAKENGTYTISINTKDVNFGYLHLIDNMTGDDIDLNVTPSYTFNAKADDYESRFKLVYAADNTDDNDFAFISNSEIILNGQGTVQIYDVNGRMISSYNDVTSISTSDMANGVYMLRLINGNNVKTQKIVVK